MDQIHQVEQPILEVVGFSVRDVADLSGMYFWLFFVVCLQLEGMEHRLIWMGVTFAFAGILVLATWGGIKSMRASPSCIQKLYPDRLELKIYTSDHCIPLTEIVAIDRPSLFGRRFGPFRLTYRGKVMNHDMWLPFSKREGEFVKQVLDRRQELIEGRSV